MVHVPLRGDGEQRMRDHLRSGVEVVRPGIAEGRAERHGPAGVHVVPMDARAGPDERRVDGHASSLPAVVRPGLRSEGSVPVQAAR